MPVIALLIVFALVVYLVLYAIGIALAAVWAFLNFLKFPILGVGLLLLCINLFVFRKNDLVEFEQDYAEVLDGSTRDRFLELMAEQRANAEKRLPSPLKPLPLAPPDRVTPHGK